jgi:hypothetical protein
MRKKWVEGEEGVKAKQAELASDSELHGLPECPQKSDTL